MAAVTDVESTGIPFFQMAELSGNGNSLNINVFLLHFSLRPLGAQPELICP